MRDETTGHETTSADILDVCRYVLEAKRAGAETCTVGSVGFDDLQWHGGGGRCQENVRKAFEAATGLVMPGRACCAYTTNLNLYALHQQGSRHGVVEVVPNVESGGRPEDAEPGDLMYFRGGPRCGTCGRSCGHTGIWLGDDLIWQHTSRGHRAICAVPVTRGQRRRFCGAYRLLPLSAEEQLHACSSWAAEARDRLITLGVTDGLRPRDPLTREEAWVMLDRILRHLHAPELE